MLVLSRKPGETIHIGNDVTVTVVAVSGNRVRVAITAPDRVTILRGELAGHRVHPGCPAAVEDPHRPL